MPSNALNSIDAIPLIGDYIPPRKIFDGLDTIFNTFSSPAFQNLSKRKQFKHINQVLLDLIQSASDESFLLSAVIDYIARINASNIIATPYSISLFEFWMNNFIDLTAEETYAVRCKIVGKKIPRCAYQSFFPIGNDIRYSGTHFVAAHLSPDIDTTVASFWGWVDAFAADVGTGQHIWSVPGGAPATSMFQIFYELFGKACCEATARTALALTLNAYDLVTQQNFSKYSGDVSTNTIDHGVNEKALILVDHQGYYVGDWRSSDVELVRQVIVLFKSCLHWFENNIHIQLIALFAKNDLIVADIAPFLAAVFDVSMGICEPALEFNERQHHDLDLFLKNVLNIEQGLNCTYRDLSNALQALDVRELAGFMTELGALANSSLFDINGQLAGDRSNLLKAIERVIIQLDTAIHYIRNYVERLDIAIQIKHHVITQVPQPYITLNSDVEEIRLKMKNYDYLTVVISEENDKLFPVGVVWANELRKPILGTVSLRDFSSSEEMRMAPYLGVISIIDHHRTALATTSVPTVILGDVQSSNVLVAELTCAINDRYSLDGMDNAAINEQLSALQKQPLEASNIRLQQRLLHKYFLKSTNVPYYIHPQRAYAEYLTFLYGILDDTDLLTKVTPRDVICVANLLNRLKTLIAGYEVEIIHFDDIPHDAGFAKQAARHILQQADMYSIYSKLYAYRTLDVEEQIALCARNEASDFFADTKDLNGCCRIGQTKLFASTIATFERYEGSIRRQWRKRAIACLESRPEIDLHMHMVSTIASAEEVHEGREGEYNHTDQMWLWGPSTVQARAHLSSFLLGFQNVIAAQDNQVTVEIHAPPEESAEIAAIFRRHFLPVPLTIHSDDDGPWAILRFRAGSINSRKSMITPFLPRIVT